MTKNNPEIKPDNNKHQKSPPPLPPLPPTSPIPIVDPTPEIYSSRKHNMDYVTVDGVILRTGYNNKSDWYLLLIKELLDNGIDFLWKYYPGANDAAISVDVTMNDSLFHTKVRNTNSRNIPVFQNLPAILDYDMRYGSKQNEHIISRGILGDATKQIATWPYVLIHTKDDGTAFTNKQWEKPLIIRSNKVERQILTHVDKANQHIDSHIKQTRTLPHTDTEIETTWPVIDEVDLNMHEIEKFCRRYIIFTTDISFKFKLIDNSTEKIENTSNSNTNTNTNTDKKNFKADLLKALTSPAARGAIKIDAPALHSITTKWNNISTIHSYKPEEFVGKITGVHDKQATTVYDVLRTLKEGTQMKKTSDTEKSIAELMLDPDKDKKFESLYHQLETTLDPPEKLSLPYSHIKAEERKKALIDRIAQLYPKHYLDKEKAVYRLLHGKCKNDGLIKVWTDDHKGYSLERNTNTLHYPFAFEIIAIPLNAELLEGDSNKPTSFIGSVNYSITPRGNKFEGDYDWVDKKAGYRKVANNIEGILEKYGFTFYDYSSAKTRLPCIIAANLASPRIDYHGHDKSRIDTNPFMDTIVEAVIKLQPEIQTFRAAGFDFSDERELREYTKPKERKFRVQDVVEELIEERKKMIRDGGGLTS